MKKIVSVILAIMIAASLCACAGKAAPKEASSGTEAAQTTAAQTAAAQTTAAPETTASAEAESAEAEEPERISAGMPNPVVEVEDCSIYEDKLGIYIDPSVITENYKAFIIAGNLASIVWTQENGNGEETEFCLRATRDAEVAKTMHGIYDADMSEPVTTTVPLTDENDIDITFMKANTEDFGIYTWKDGQIFYSMTYDKEMSQMALSEILDRVMDAARIRYHKHVVSALPGSESFDDCIMPVSFEKEGITEKDGKYFLECEVFEEEYFDMVEIHLLQPGDSIVISGDEVYEIETLERDASGDLVINGGIENGGVSLAPGEGGTYVMHGPDDIKSYRNRGKHTFEVSEDVVFTDTADIEHGMEEKVFKGIDETRKHLAEADYFTTFFYSTSVRTENGVIAEIREVYVP